MVSNCAQSDILKFHLSFNKAHKFKGEVWPSVSHFFVLFGSFIKPQLNLDLSVQPALLLFCLMFLSGLCSFFKAMFPTVNDLWVSKLKKADVPCDSCWILNDSTGVMVINNLNLSRSEIDKASQLLLQSFDFSTLYTKIDLVDKLV